MKIVVSPTGFRERVNDVEADKLTRMGWKIWSAVNQKALTRSECSCGCGRTVFN